MRRTICKLAHYLKYPMYKQLEMEYQAEEHMTEEEIMSKLIASINNALTFARNNSSFYSELIPNDFYCRSLEDLSMIPITNKNDIRTNFDDINNASEFFRSGSTGGSTGESLKYTMSEKDYTLGVINLHHGFRRAGYRLGDQLITIAGGSLIPSFDNKIKSKIFDYVLANKHLSSYGITQETFGDFYKTINKIRPLFIRGYASSLFMLAKFMEEKMLRFNFDLKGVFSTSEMLSDQQRKVIERTFSAPVFNQYGLNDGGLSAYECSMHNGFHVDTNRALLEVVDENGKLIYDRVGRIIATTLHNTATPFVRYETGDLGILSKHKCSCGLNKPILRSLDGRVTDYLDINGVKIGSPVLTVLMGKINVEEYKIIQKKDSSILIKMVPLPTYDREKEEQFIIESFNKNGVSTIINFEYLDTLIHEKGNGKLKPIIREK